MFPSLRRAAGVWLALTLACAVTPRVEAGGDASLDEANRRWSGARCRLLFDVPIKKGRDGEGWSGSKWIVPAQGRVVLKGITSAFFRVSNRDLLPGGVVRAGTAFVAEGWSYEDPKGKDGLRLDLRFEGIAARARMTFHGNFGKDLDVDDLGPVEQWARLDIFEVSAAAEPLKVAAGAQAVLVVTYEVRGLPPGRTVEVTERRVILRAGEVLTTLDATVTRQAGIHRSTQPLVVPASLTPGILELRITVTAGGPESSGRTLFEVTAR